MSSHSSPLEQAKITWQNGEPVSTAYNDVYFSKAGGLEETRYVFLENNYLTRSWAALEENSTFVIAETGFGTGLNFLCAAKLWLKTAPASACLHFLSFEKFPLNHTDLGQALSPWEALSSESAELIAHYPPLCPGYHRLNLFDGRIQLTLALGDVNQLLPLSRARVDAWFLDGFAPAKNPDMWTESLFHDMARLSHPETRFATFTAAGFVRRGLQAAGFQVEKRPGFGHKRDMLAGYLESETKPACSYRDKPWFHFQQAPLPNKTACVIGGGLAGTQSALALARRGYQVTLIERHEQLAQEASGNHAGVIYGKFSPHDSAQYRFYQHAYLFALHHIPELLGPADKHNWQQCGVLQLAINDKEAGNQLALAEGRLWPETIFHRVDAAQASELAGIPLDYSGLYFPTGGWVHPPALCQQAVQHHNIKVVYATEALTLKRHGNHWRVGSQEQQFDCALAIICNGSDATRFQQTASLPLKRIRGQVSHVAATTQSSQLKTVICHEGYITPARSGIHPVGATFNLKDDETGLRESDHQKNFEQLCQHVPALSEHLPAKKHKIEQGRVGFRCQTPDYLPVVGPVPDEHANLEQYGNLRKGMKHGEFAPGSYLPGLYLNVAHGSRGITSTGLAAEVLASYINNEPAPVDQEVLHAIHPARFLIRDIKRKAR